MLLLFETLPWLGPSQEFFHREGKCVQCVESILLHERCRNTYIGYDETLERIMLARLPRPTCDIGAPYVVHVGNIPERG